MMRVAALLDTVQVSGPGRQLAALAAALREHGVEVVVITFHRAGRSRSPYLDYLERAGVRHIVVPETGPLDRRLPSRLVDALSDLSPDIVQTHGYKPAALAWLLRRRGATWPWIGFFHGATRENVKVRFYHWLTNRLLGAADRVIVMSRAQRAEFARLGERARVIHNAVLELPSSELSRGAAEARVGTGARIGVVGRLSPEKGVDVFLRACGLLAERGVAFSAVVAGDGPERTALERLCDTLGLRHRVAFPGATSDVAALYASLDILVIPSRSEGLPNVLLEALRADLPVVATRVGAIPDVLDAPDAGILVPPGSPAALADGIVRGLALGDDEGAREARRRVVERFSLRRRVDDHLRLYGDVLGRDLGAPPAAAAPSSSAAWTPAG